MFQHYRYFKLNGVRFKVLRSVGDDWGFWKFYASGQWETTTVEEADRLLKPGSLLFDIGAWLGPLTLWEAKRGVTVVACEPDLVAFHDLVENCIANDVVDKVAVYQVAVSDRPGEATLNLDMAGGGDAHSSMLRQDLNGSITVKTTTIDFLMQAYGQPDVIKIDVEGAEALIMPAAGPRLRHLGIPVLLATHEQWMTVEQLVALRDEMAHWRVKDLRNQMWLLEP